MKFDWNLNIRKNKIYIHKMHSQNIDFNALGNAGYAGTRTIMADENGKCIMRGLDL